MERDRMLEVQAICVVSKTRAKRGKASSHGVGEAEGAGASSRSNQGVQEELAWEAGSECKLVIDLASCMKEEGVHVMVLG